MDVSFSCQKVRAGKFLNLNSSSFNPNPQLTPFFSVLPSRLAAHASEEDLARALKKVHYEDEIEPEATKLLEEVKEEKLLGVVSWREVFAKGNNLFLGMSFQAFQQLCGINAIMFYAPDILNTFFTEEQAIKGTFGLNLINFLATFITITTVDRFGRVKLLVSGGLIMLLALVMNAILSSLDQTMTVGWLVLVFAAVFIIGFAFSWGPVVWIVCAEMFPFRTRSKSTGLTTMTNWLCTTVVGAVFPVASTASLSGCFAFFSVAIAVGTTVVYLFQPETANLSSLQIEAAYKTHKPALKRKDW